MIFRRLLIGLFLTLGLAALLATGLFGTFFNFWKIERRSVLDQGSELVETDQGLVEVHVTGREGLPVLVIHGGAGGYDQALSMVQGWPGEGFRIIAPSRPGYLRTPLGSGLLPEQQATLLSLLLDKLGADRVGVLAVAEGASAALMLAQNHPEKVAALALLSPVTSAPPGWVGAQPLPGQMALSRLTGDVGAWWFWRKLREKEPVEATGSMLEATRSFVDGLERYETVAAVLGNPDQLEWVRQFGRSMTPLTPRDLGTRNDMAQLRAPPRLRPERITAPLLMVVGELDTVRVAGSGQKLAERFEGAELRVLPGTGFLLFAGPEHESLRAALLEFFRTAINESNP